MADTQNDFVFSANHEIVGNAAAKTQAETSQRLLDDTMPSPKFHLNQTAINELTEGGTEVAAGAMIGTAVGIGTGRAVAPYFAGAAEGLTMVMGGGRQDFSAVATEVLTEHGGKYGLIAGLGLGASIYLGQKAVQGTESLIASFEKHEK